MSNAISLPAKIVGAEVRHAAVGAAGAMVRVEPLQYALLLDRSFSLGRRPLLLDRKIFGHLLEDVVLQGLELQGLQRLTPADRLLNGHGRREIRQQLLLVRQVQEPAQHAVLRVKHVDAVQGLDRGVAVGGAALQGQEGPAPGLAEPGHVLGSARGGAARKNVRAALAIGPVLRSGHLLGPNHRRSVQVQAALKQHHAHCHVVEQHGVKWM